MPGALTEEVSVQSASESLSDSLGLQAVRQGQRAWSHLRIAQRLGVLRRFRNLLATEGSSLAKLVSPHLTRTLPDTLTAEVLPLAEAVRYLERRAPTLLRPLRVNKADRPAWLRGVELEVQRDPWGVVLVIGPANYPLFLPGVQTVQALAAGNAVIWKPGVGGATIAHATAALLKCAGLPEGLLTVTDESPEAAQKYLDIGVDKVVLTGSGASGKAVLRKAAETLTPPTVELSGCDAAFVLSDANIGRAVDALVFGLRLNGSGTCIAPRRVFLHRDIAASFKGQLLERLETAEAISVPNRVLDLVGSLVANALEHHANLLTPDYDASGLLRPVCIDEATPEMLCMRTDVPAPLLSLATVSDDDSALTLAGACPYALGATVFGERKHAEAFARQVSAGIVVVNDMIVPTADPRISFGGRGHSGFGKSRGPEGLLEMTVSKTIAVQRAGRLRHLEPPHPRGAELFAAYLHLVHGRGLHHRARALAALWGAITKS